VMYESTFSIVGKPISVVVLNLGLDLSLSISGGDRPHIGAVALAVPRPSSSDPKVISATTSVIAVTGHKEDVIATHVADRLAASLGCIVTVSCGIHFDKINTQILENLQNQIETEIEQIKEWYEPRE